MTLRACHRRKNGPATPLRVFSVSAKLAAALADASRARAKVGFERGICFLEEAHAVAEDLRIMPEFQDQESRLLHPPAKSSSVDL